MPIFTLILIISLLVIIPLWILSEYFIYKDINKKGNHDNVWLIVNVLLPFVGCFLYYISHQKVGEK